jgi:hypothetical protein
LAVLLSIEHNVFEHVERLTVDIIPEVIWNYKSRGGGGGGGRRKRGRNVIYRLKKR